MRPEDTPPSDPAFLRTDARQRRNLTLLLAGVIAFAILFYSLCLPTLTNWVLTGYTDTALRKFALVCYSIAALLLVVVAYAASYARRVLRSGRFPLPGTWVYRDTRQLDGAAARRCAWVLMGVAACLAIIAVYVAAQPHFVRARILPPTPVAAPAVVKPLQVPN